MPLTDSRVICSERLAIGSDAELAAWVVPLQHRPLLEGFGSHVVMTSIFTREQAPRWRRGQRFGLSAAGAEAEAQYQTALKSSHDQGGRQALDQALVAWAAVFGVRPRDGVYLSELRIAVQTLPELVDCLEICGTTRSEVKDGLDRLISAKLAEPVS